MPSALSAENPLPIAVAPKATPKGIRASKTGNYDLRAGDEGLHLRGFRPPLLRDSPVEVTGDARRLDLTIPAPGVTPVLDRPSETWLHVEVRQVRRIDALSAITRPFDQECLFRRGAVRQPRC